MTCFDRWIVTDLERSLDKRLPTQGCLLCHCCHHEKDRSVSSLVSGGGREAQEADPSQDQTPSQCAALYCFQPPSFQMVCYTEFLAVLTDLLSTPGSPHKKGRRFLPCAPLWGSNVLYGALGLPTPSSLRVWKKRGRIIMRPPSSSAVHRHRSSWTEAFLVPSRYRAYVLLEKAGA